MVSNREDKPILNRDRSHRNKSFIWSNPSNKTRIDLGLPRENLGFL